ncbi:MAG: Mth938-like domain-containing protein [Halanaerobiales bacterium]
MKIESYSFGRIIIDGNTYTSDLIILPDKIISDWWREKGHELQTKDLTAIFDSLPSILVIGTGKMGIMNIRDNVKKKLQRNNIDYIVERTEVAVKKYNQLLADGKKPSAVFHLTC